MRKLLLITAAVAAAIGLAVAGEPSFGTFTDTRDGQTYKTVKMPDGKIWMAQNINYQTESGSWCYKNKADNCDKYGRLYNWKTAKTVCPAGYHLPSYQEWNSLTQTVGGKRERDKEDNISWYNAGKTLKAKHSWKVYQYKRGIATDDYGFSALPGGFRIPRDGSFGHIDESGFWWTDSERDSVYNFRQGLCMNYDYNDVLESGFIEGYGLSVRCVADNP
jgi:uncharacterized protein (TIGR02145 family)